MPTASCLCASPLPVRLLSIKPKRARHSPLCSSVHCRVSSAKLREQKSKWLLFSSYRRRGQIWKYTESQMCFWNTGQGVSIQWVAWRAAFNRTAPLWAWTEAWSSQVIPENPDMPLVELVKKHSPLDWPIRNKAGHRGCSLSRSTTTQHYRPRYLFKAAIMRVREIRGPPENQAVICWDGQAAGRADSGKKIQELSAQHLDIQEQIPRGGQTCWLRNQGRSWDRDMNKDSVPYDFFMCVVFWDRVSL